MEVEETQEFQLSLVASQDTLVGHLIESEVVERVFWPSRKAAVCNAGIIS